MGKECYSGGSSFIFGRYGRITETDDPDILDVHVVGPYNTPLRGNVVTELAKKLDKYGDLHILDGELWFHTATKYLDDIASILKIRRKKATNQEHMRKFLDSNPRK
jgi:hypothetical protein